MKKLLIILVFSLLSILQPKALIAASVTLYLPAATQYEIQHNQLMHSVKGSAFQLHELSAGDHQIRIYQHGRQGIQFILILVYEGIIRL